MKVGDLVWYNCAGSTRTGLVLGFTKSMWLDHAREADMMKIYWLGGHGARPVMYNTEGRRLFHREVKNLNSFECYVSAKSSAGLDMFKVVSSA